jgi:hypothetical protein
MFKNSNYNNVEKDRTMHANETKILSLIGLKFPYHYF